MKKIIPVLLLSLLLMALSGQLKAEVGDRMSVTVQYSAQGKTYSTVVAKTDGLATFPIAISDTAKWVMTVQKRSGEKTFSVTIDDPALTGRAGKDAPAPPMTIFSASFDVVNGKAITLLKTERYTLDLTMLLE